MVAMLLVATGMVRSTSGQSLVSRLKRVPDGEVRLAFAARNGICGDGRTFIRDRSSGPGNFITMDSWDGDKSWRNRPCEEGPVRVALMVRAGEIRSVKIYVGGSWPSGGANVTDWGQLGANDAALGLIELARTAGSDHDDLIFPATIADSAVIWPTLLQMARDRTVHRSTRSKAVFWVSQIAGDKAAEGLNDLVADDSEDQEVREQAVFALSQLPKDDGVPVLVRVARTNKDPEIRKKAMFWLGQSEDPRALALFEEILSRPN